MQTVLLAGRGGREGQGEGLPTPALPVQPLSKLVGRGGHCSGHKGAPLLPHLSACHLLQF